MTWTSGLEKIVQTDEPLAMYTWFQLGGNAEYFAEPHDQETLKTLVARSAQACVPLWVLGGGSNILVRDAGVKGLVIRMTEALTPGLEISGNRITCGGGISLGRLIAAAVRAGLGGVEELVGIPGTVGGALRGNSGTDSVSIGQFVKRVTVLTPDGSEVSREDAELSFGYRQSSLDDGIILEAEFAFPEENPHELALRMQKQWIMRKSAQPMGHQCAGRVFKNPADSGYSAAELIEMAGLKGTRIGGAAVSDRSANFIVTDPECSSTDVLRLVDIIREQVADRFKLELELELEVW